MMVRDGFRHTLLILVAAIAVNACSQAEFSKAPGAAGATNPDGTAGGGTGTGGGGGGTGGGGGGTGGGGGGGGGGGPTPPPVCDPFNGPPPGSQNGISGTIHYLNDSQPLYGDVREYFQYGTKANAQLFLSSLFVPTRMFDQGFAGPGGTPLIRDNGTTLIEKFALSVGSTIRLAAGDSVGFKQFAILSDDGAVFTIKHNGIEKVNVDNNGITPTRLAVGMIENIYFDQNTALPMRMDYFQGPRYHISLILLWRNAASGAPQAEPLAGFASNEEWFDPNNQVQQARYNELLSRGWRPLRPQNYWLDGTNPCAQ